MAQNDIDRARGRPIPTDASRLRLPPVTLVDLYLGFDEEPCVNWNTAKRDSIPSRFSVVIVACGRRGSVKIGGRGVGSVFSGDGRMGRPATSSPTSTVYSSQSLYKIVNFRGIVPVHVLALWHLKIPPGIHLFLWLLSKNKLLTR